MYRPVYRCLHETRLAYRLRPDVRCLSAPAKWKTVRLETQRPRRRKLALLVFPDCSSPHGKRDQTARRLARLVVSNSVRPRRACVLH